MHPGPGHYKASSTYGWPCDGQLPHPPLPQIIHTVSASEEPKKGVWLLCILRVLCLTLAFPSSLSPLCCELPAGHGVCTFWIDVKETGTWKNKRITQDRMKSAEAQPQRQGSSFPERSLCLSIQMWSTVVLCPPHLTSLALEAQPPFLAASKFLPVEAADGSWGMQIICPSPEHVPVLLNSANCSVLHSMEATRSLTEVFLAGTGKREQLAKGGTLLRCCLQA